MKWHILLLIILICNAAVAQKTCNTTKTHIITEHREHQKYILFFKTNWQKHLQTEKAVDANGKVLVKAVMKSICSYDACDGGTFRRVVLLNGEIHKVYAVRRGKCKVIRYDLCGNKIAKETIDGKTFEEKYSFNTIPSNPKEIH